MNNMIFLGFECVNVFKENNAQQFVFNARCLKDGQVYTDVGIGGNMQEAKMNAKHNLSDMMKAILSHGKNYEYCYDNYNLTQTNIIKNKSNLNGGGNKPISDGQINCLQKMASQKGMNINDLTQKQYGKDLSQLIGSQADELIKSLKGIR